MGKTTKLAADFTVAWVSTYVLASIAHSQFVLAELRSLGVDISPATWLLTTAEDLLGLLLGYGTVIAAGLLLGFGLINLLSKWLPLGLWRFGLAGAVTMIAVQLAMHPIFEVTLIAGARTTAGLLCQIGAGLIGGMVFASRRRVTSHNPILG